MNVTSTNLAGEASGTSSSSTTDPSTLSDSGKNGHRRLLQGSLVVHVVLGPSESLAALLDNSDFLAAISVAIASGFDIDREQVTIQKVSLSSSRRLLQRKLNEEEKLQIDYELKVTASQAEAIKENFSTAKGKEQFSTTFSTSLASAIQVHELDVVIKEVDIVKEPQEVSDSAGDDSSVSPSASESDSSWFQQNLALAISIICAPVLCCCALLGFKLRASKKPSGVSAPRKKTRKQLNARAEMYRHRQVAPPPLIPPPSGTHTEQPPPPPELDHAPSPPIDDAPAPLPPPAASTPQPTSSEAKSDGGGN